MECNSGGGIEGSKERKAITQVKFDKRILRLTETPFPEIVLFLQTSHSSKHEH